MEKLLIISADNHAGPRAADYLPYIEPRYREAVNDLIAEEAEFIQISAPFSTFTPEALEVIDDRRAIRSGGEAGGWDLDLRLAEMDAEGVAAEIVYAGHQKQMCAFFTHVNRRHPPDLRSAGARAHHRWFLDAMGPAKDRIFGVADPGACVDMPAAVKELNWAADNGFVSISCPGTIAEPALPPLYDPYFEPFWAACEERGLVLAVHTGWGSEQGRFFDFNEKLKSDPELAKAMEKGQVEAYIQKMRKARGAGTDLGPRRVFWQLILAGVFDRHPGLKIAFAEIRSDWLPATLAYLDERFESEGGVAELKPSEYFQRQGYISPTSPRPSEIAQLRQVGVDRMMFGIDYPHPEGAWPNSLDWARAVFAGLGEHEARRVMGENAVACYGLDGPALRAIAQRIGPSVSDILGAGDRVDPRVIAHFDSRAGYARPAETVDRDLLARHVADDLAGARAWRTA